jgi:phospholipase D1/2
VFKGFKLTCQPDDYINFFSLRGWAKFKSGVLTTEQVYIHGKTMVVDDREVSGVL